MSQSCRIDTGTVYIIVHKTISSWNYGSRVIDSLVIILEEILTAETMWGSAFCLYGCITALYLLAFNELAWISATPQEPTDAEAGQSLQDTWAFQIQEIEHNNKFKHQLCEDSPFKLSLLILFTSMCLFLFGEGISMCCAVHLCDSSLRPIFARPLGAAWQLHAETWQCLILLCEYLT